MSRPLSPDNGGPTQSEEEEWLVTTRNGVVTRIERIEKTANSRVELTAEEYAMLAANYYAVYYAGSRDYAQALASGDVHVIHFYQGMFQYLGAMGQT